MRRLLFIFLAMPLWGQQVMPMMGTPSPVASSGPTILGHTAMAGSAGAASNATTAALNTTGASLLIVPYAVSGSTETITIKDCASPGPCTGTSTNTWTCITEQASAGNNKVGLCYVFSPTTGTSQVFTSNSSAAIRLTVGAIAVSGASALDGTSTGSSTGGGGATVLPGSITPTSTDLFVTIVSANNVSETFTINSGYSASNNSTTWASGYATLVSGVANNPTWTCSASDILSSKQVAFK